jgi:hypothetical protein
VRLVTASGEDPSSAWHLRDSELNTAPLLEALAVLAPTQAPQLDTGWLTEHGGGGLVVAVVGGVEPIDTRVLRRMHAHAGSALAVALDVEAWVSGGVGTGGAVGLLTRQGWRAVTLGPRDRLESAWEELGRGSTQSARSRGGAVAAGTR